MSGDARRVLGQADVARLFAARSMGGTCAACGRALAGDEPIWMERLDIVDAGRRVGSYRAPVGRECASPELVRESETAACLSCGRGIHYGPTPRPRDLVLCSKRCCGRYVPAPPGGGRRG
jgi:hypothetical protein